MRIISLLLLFSLEVLGLEVLVPNQVKRGIAINLKEEKYFSVNLNLLKSNTFYRVHLNYPGPIGVDFKITFICGKITHKNLNYDTNPSLKDNEDFDFYTNEEGIPTEKVEQFFIIISVTVTSDQFYELKDIPFNIELLENQYSFVIKPLASYTLKGLFPYLFGFMFFFPIFFCLFKEQIRVYLAKLYEIKEN